MSKVLLVVPRRPKNPIPIPVADAGRDGALSASPSTLRRERGLTPGASCEDLVFAKPGMFDSVVSLIAFLVCCCSLGVIIVFIVAIFSDAVAQGLHGYIAKIAEALK